MPRRLHHDCSALGSQLPLKVAPGEERCYYFAGTERVAVVVVAAVAAAARAAAVAVAAERLATDAVVDAIVPAVFEVKAVPAAGPWPASELAVAVAVVDAVGYWAVVEEFVLVVMEAGPAPAAVAGSVVVHGLGAQSEAWPEGSPGVAPGRLVEAPAVEQAGAFAADLPVEKVAGALAVSAAGEVGHWPGSWVEVS